MPATLGRLNVCSAARVSLSPSSRSTPNPARADTAVGTSTAARSAARRVRHYGPMVGEKRQGKSVEEFLAPQRRIFLVHGRDMRLRKAMVEYLNSLDLRVVSWTEALVSTGLGTPYTGDVVVAGMAMSDAVVVLLTPDDLGMVKPDFLSESDGPGERDLSGQPRMNVIFEAGMAMARDRVRTVLVEVGGVRPMTDTEGLNVVRFGRGEPEARHQLASRLQGLGLQVDMSNHEWLSAGDFSAPSVQVPKQ